MSPFSAALCGAVAFAGIALAVAGWYGVLPALTGPGAGRSPHDVVPRVILGATGFLLGILLTR